MPRLTQFSSRQLTGTANRVIITSGMILSLDASKTTSYPGSGNTWYDLSGNSNNGTLVNSPTFSTTDGNGCFVLDGVSNYISLPTTGFAPTSITIDYWIKRNADNGYFLVIDNSDNPELRLQFTSSNLSALDYDDGAYFFTPTVTTTFSTSLWYNIIMTLTNGLQKLYINGNQEILTGTGIYTGGPGGNAGEQTLGTYNRPGAGYGGYASVKIGSYRVYNQAFTDAQALNNFLATRARFGV